MLVELFEPRDKAGTIRVTYNDVEIVSYGFLAGQPPRFSFGTPNKTGVAKVFLIVDGVETLVLDALRPRKHPTHFSIDEAVQVARRVHARRTLLVHMSHDVLHAEVAARLPEGVELAYDGLEVPLV